LVYILSQESVKNQNKKYLYIPKISISFFLFSLKKKKLLLVLMIYLSYFMILLNRYYTILHIFL